MSSLRLLTRATAVGAAALAAALGAPAAGAAPYVGNHVLVGYDAANRTQPQAMTAAIGHQLGVASAGAPAPRQRVLTLRRGQTVSGVLRRLRAQPGVAFAVPDYIAHATGIPWWIPNDPGLAHRAGGWQSLQWNFLPAPGVNAPEAWANLRGVRHPGGKGVTIAVLDTGVAFRNWKQFRAAPDFNHTRFVAPYDFVTGNRYPLDRDGHGTFVTGILAASTNNGYGLTGLAYGASIMPVRVLGDDGTGYASTISHGIRYAVDHHAQIINLSLEFSLDVAPTDIPDIISAIRYAHSKGVVVVAASGNEGVAQVAYPARATDVISVGATTRDKCLASYSNDGSGLDLVAPGGSDNNLQLADPNCHQSRPLPDISQMTFADPVHPSHFSYPGGWYGTSMAAPHVAAIAALVIASGVIGRHPTPEAILHRLEQTAVPLGGAKPNQDYGYGLVNAGAATLPGAVAARGR